MDWPERDWDAEVVWCRTCQLRTVSEFNNCTMCNADVNLALLFDPPAAY